MSEPPTPTGSATSDQIRGSALLLAGLILSSAVDFGSQVLLVRHLSKVEFGAWAYALAIVVLLAALAQLEMRQAVARFVPVYMDRDDRARALGAVAVALGVALGLGLILAVAVLVLIDGLGFRPTEDPESLRLLSLIAFLVPVQAVDGVLTGLFAAFGATRVIFVRQSLVAPALRLGLVLALIAFSADVSFFAVGYVAVTALGVLLYVSALRGVFARNRLTARPPAAPRVGRAALPAAEMIQFVLPLLTSTLVWILMESSDAVLLGFFKDASAVASFRVVLPLARMNQLVATTFSVLYLPVAARAVARGVASELAGAYWRTTAWMTVLTFPFVVLTVAFAPTVVTTVYGSAYASSGTILALLSAAYFFQTVTGFNGLTLRIHGRLRYTVAIDVAMSVVNVAVNLVLIPALGPLGAAIGTTATLVLYNILKQLGLRRYTTIPWLPPRNRRLYIGIAVIGVACLALGAALPALPVVALIVTAAAGILGLYLGLPALDVATEFPEVARLPVLRRLVATPQTNARPGDPPDAADPPG